jgi:hypothetical protein
MAAAQPLWELPPALLVSLAADNGGAGKSRRFA